MKNCKNGGKTIIDLKDGPDSDPYRCECAHGYSGDRCEIGMYSKIYSQGDKLKGTVRIKT